MITLEGPYSDLELIIYLKVPFPYALEDGFAVAREELELPAFRIYRFDKNEAVCDDRSVE